MHKLNAHSSNQNNDYDCFFDININEDFVTFDFSVFGEKAPLSSDIFVSHFKNWGLWNFDVVEFFLTFSDNSNEYLELQISPLNQLFALEISTPRRDFSYPNNFDIDSGVFIDGNNWHGRLSVPIDLIPGNSNKLRGNITSILGRPRNHFALNINKDNRADFHRPDLFLNIGEL